MRSRTTIKARFVPGLAALAAVVGLAGGPATGDLIAYDGFSNGPLPDIGGSGGGSGWAGPWQDFGSSQLTAIDGTGLSYAWLRTLPGAAVTPAGGSFDAANYARAYPPIPAPADHLFISFLIRPDSGFGTYGGISFGGYTMIGMPLTMNTYGMRLGRYLFVDSGIEAVQGSTSLLVLELTVAGAQTTYRLYVNPDLTRGKPAVASAQYTLSGATLPQAFSLMNDGGFTTDEFRIATTWAEAAPPPATSCFTVTAPIAVAACGGATSMFTVSTAGSPGPFMYRWYKGPSALADGPSGFGSSFAGTTTPTLTITAVGASDAAFYYCVVTDSCGSVTSGAAAMSVCMADFNCSGASTVQDIFDFLSAYFAADPTADFNRSGGISVQDIFDFLAAYFAGC